MGGALNKVNVNVIEMRKIKRFSSVKVLNESRSHIIHHKASSTKNKCVSSKGSKPFALRVHQQS